MTTRYVLNDINLADWQSVCIIDTELDVVVLHFNITFQLGYDAAIKLGQSIVDNLNLEK